MSQKLFIASSESGRPGMSHFWPVGRLDKITDGYRFVYTHGARLTHGFYPFPGMSDFNKVYESETIFPLFVNRILSKSRPEYKEFLEWCGFDPTVEEPDPISILRITEGIRQTDNLEVFGFDPLDADGFLTCRFFLRDIFPLSKEAEAQINSLRSGDVLMAERCKTCGMVSRPLRIFLNKSRELLGVLPNYLSSEVRAQPKVKVKVVKVNPDAPFQYRLLCEASIKWKSCWAHPTDRQSFQPIPKLDT